jgi:hypothetical protein
MSFAASRRRKLFSSLRHSGMLLAIGVFLLAATVLPLHFGWWDSALPAAIATGIAAVLAFAVAVNTPLEAFAYVHLYVDQYPYDGPRPTPRGFNRFLYRESGRLDAIARAAGLAPLSAFESPDPLETHDHPRWHSPEAALATVEYLLKQADPALQPHLAYLRTWLEAARDKGARFYFLVLTLAGGTNARVEALRRGDLSVLR